jgi:hypothetical protein
VIRAFLVIVIIGAVIAVILWDRSDKSKKRQVYYSLYNKSLASAKDKSKIYGTSVNILEIMDETDIGPNILHRLLRDLERSNFINLSQNVAKLTPEGVAYFKFRYLGEKK